MNSLLYPCFPSLWPRIPRLLIGSATNLLDSSLTGTIEYIRSKKQRKRSHVE